jgi:hypothetical protein
LVDKKLTKKPRTRGAGTFKVLNRNEPENSLLAICKLLETQNTPEELRDNELEYAVRICLFKCAKWLASFCPDHAEQVASMNISLPIKGDSWTYS